MHHLWIGLVILLAPLSWAQEIEYSIITAGPVSYVEFIKENKAVQIPTDSVEAFTSGYQEFLDSTIVHEMSYLGLRMRGYRYVKGDFIQPTPSADGFSFYLTEIRYYPYKESLRQYEIH